MNRRLADSRLRIGELAGELGLNPKTIRYYEAFGLLPAPRRTRAGYRLYGDADRERLRFIAKAKAIGLTLGEIGEILALRAHGTEPCPHVQGLLDRRLRGREPDPDHLRRAVRRRGRGVPGAPRARGARGRAAPRIGGTRRTSTTRSGDD